jgi:hypothetical protein
MPSSGRIGDLCRIRGYDSPSILTEPRTNKIDAMLAESTPDHLVILVHGINTRALWMNEVKPALERAGFAVAQTSFGKFSLLRFLSPLRLGRRAAIDRVLTDIRTARESHKLSTGSYPTKMSVISHSFGTYVVATILLEAADLEWERVIFCGSVVREDFPIQRVLKSFRHPLLNEIGTQDYWPALAESAGWGYGSVGSTGFNRPPVETRWHFGFRHSDFLTDDFCTKFWVPFLRGAKPIAADKASPMPSWIRFLTLFPLRWIMLGSVVLVAPSAFIFGAESLGYAWPAKIARLTQLSLRQSASSPTISTPPPASQSSSNPQVPRNKLSGRWIMESGSILAIRGSDWFHPARGAGSIIFKGDDSIEVEYPGYTGQRCAYRVHFAAGGNTLFLEAANLLQSIDYCPSGRFARSDTP